MIATGFEVRIVPRRPIVCRDEEWELLQDPRRLHRREDRDGQRDSCYVVVADDQPARSPLPIELSSIVTSLENVTRELVKKLNRDEATAVVTDLCERLRAIPDEKRGPNRPFTR